MADGALFGRCLAAEADDVNLDGGGSTAPLHRGHLLNHPDGDQDRPSRKPRPIATAAIFQPAYATARREAA